MKSAFSKLWHLLWKTYIITLHVGNLTYVNVVKWLEWQVVSPVFNSPKKCLFFKWHWKIGPFTIRTYFDHSKTGLVGFSDPHSIVGILKAELSPPTTTQLSPNLNKFDYALKSYWKSKMKNPSSIVLGLLSLASQLQHWDVTSFILLNTKVAPSFSLLPLSL